MEHITTDPSANAFLIAIEARKTAVLASVDFQEGFSSGLEAYENYVADFGRLLTPHETCKQVCRELDPHRLEMEKRLFEDVEEDTETSSAFRAGFLAGWIYTHLTGLVELPNTQPLHIAVNCDR